MLIGLTTVFLVCTTNLHSKLIQCVDLLLKQPSKLLSMQVYFSENSHETLFFAPSHELLSSFTWFSRLNEFRKCRIIRNKNNKKHNGKEFLIQHTTRRSNITHKLCPLIATDTFCLFQLILSAPRAKMTRFIFLKYYRKNCWKFKRTVKNNLEAALDLSSGKKVLKIFWKLKL